MTIHIEDLKFQCIIGILDFERLAPQDVIINLKIEYDYKKDEFINYALVAQKVKEVMIKRQFYLLEEALEELSIALHTEFTAIKNLTIKIIKPSILDDCKVGLSNYYEFQS